MSAASRLRQRQNGSEITDVADALKKRAGTAKAYYFQKGQRGTIRGGTEYAMTDTGSLVNITKLLKTTTKEVVAELKKPATPAEAQ